MTEEERRLQLDRELNEVGASGGKVWVEAYFGAQRVLICHHIEPKGRLALVSVMVPDAGPQKVRYFIEAVRAHWGSRDWPTGGTIAGRDPGRPGEQMSSYYGEFDPSLGVGPGLGVKEIEEITRGYAEDNHGRPFLKEPRIVLAEVVVRGEI